MIEFVFLDLDDTILDFQKAERIAISKTIADFGVEPTPEICEQYSRINKAHWEALERKEMTREEILVRRFDVLFRQLGVKVDAQRCSERYAENLALGHYFLPGAQEAVERLSKKYKLYLASNGTSRVQNSRLKSAKIGKYFREIFISQEMGANKPDKRFFEQCFARIPGFDPQKAMIVGDSLTSDMLGGRNAGIATCWINPSHKPGREDIPVDYELESLSQLEALLDEIH